MNSLASFASLGAPFVAIRCQYFLCHRVIMTLCVSMEPLLGGAGSLAVQNRISGSRCRRSNDSFQFWLGRTLASLQVEALNKCRRDFSQRKAVVLIEFRGKVLRPPSERFVQKYFVADRLNSCSSWPYLVLIRDPGRQAAQGWRCEGSGGNGVQSQEIARIGGSAAAAPLPEGGYLRRSDHTIFNSAIEKGQRFRTPYGN
eukprot:1626221-Amphidinium_carterae.1